ncbi:MAG: methyltransferase domain-containing protein [Anaerolineae bacterium]|nr:methyltransferase domain-containing protein [Anaerolineae bacterium]
MKNNNQALAQALWKIYRRPTRPPLWEGGGNLPWDEPAFSERMLAEHLDESHGAASRTTAERARQIDWLWARLGLQPEQHLLDVTCGPGLYAVEFARRGCQVTGLDFGPAALAYATDLARSEGLAGRCRFIEQDVRQWSPPAGQFDAAMLIYGQLAVFPPAEAAALLTRLAESLKPGGRLVLELLDPARVDKSESTWWFTDDSGLWGEAPFLHLGERFWDAASQTSIERFHLVHLETGALTEITLCDQTYRPEVMTDLLRRSGFRTVELFPAWAGLELYDAAEWLVYLAEK